MDRGDDSAARKEDRNAIGGPDQHAVSWIGGDQPIAVTDRLDRIPRGVDSMNNSAVDLSAVRG